jgi:ubiquinone/menaquinone biosynthesis C-methylase UbiE
VKSSNTDDFDAYAEDYRAVHAKNIRITGRDSFYFAEDKVRKLISFEQNANYRVLDLGCGDGLSAVYFSRYFPNWKIDGVDISERSIVVAKGRHIPNTNFICSNAGHINFEDGAFDIVFTAGMLHHVPEIERPSIINEIYRLLKPGGRLYVFEHNPINPATQYLVRTCEFDEHAHLLKARNCIALLRGAGFNKARVRYISFFPPAKIFSIFHPLEKHLSWLPIGAQYFIRALR